MLWIVAFNLIFPPVLEYENSLLHLFLWLQESHACPLSGAVSLCNPFNLVYAFEKFTKGFNRVYDKALARSIRNIFKRYFSTTCFCLVSAFINSISRFPQFHFNLFVFYRHILLFEDIEGEYNIPLALNARQVRDFDEGLTRGMLVTAIRESNETWFAYISLC